MASSWPPVSGSERAGRVADVQQWNEPQWRHPLPGLLARQALGRVPGSREGRPLSIDRGRLTRLREGQGEIANHIIDEYAVGRLSRREFLVRGTVAGISLSVLGAVLSACGSSDTTAPRTVSTGAAGKAGATINVGIEAPTAAINPLTVADLGGSEMLAQTGEYLCLSDQRLALQPVLATSWSSNSTACYARDLPCHFGQP